ncbi:hypothetical protein ISR94_00055 [Candidatus Microgenomates bacterium]|nr:hypothetical protein [Candidatus Microgenomates bacterium]
MATKAEIKPRERDQGITMEGSRSDTKPLTQRRAEDNQQKKTKDLVLVRRENKLETL